MLKAKKVDSCHSIMKNKRMKVIIYCVYLVIDTALENTAKSYFLFAGFIPFYYWLLEDKALHCSS